jgi:hypothetical protein
MKKITGEQKEKVFNIFPTLDLDLLIYSEPTELAYKVFSIDMFKEGLTHEEADSKLLFYSDDLNQEKLKEYLSIETKYLEALQDVFDHYNLVNLDHQPINKEISASDKFSYGIDELAFYEFENKEEFNETCRDGLRERESFVFLFPEQKMILMSNFDLNIILYTVDDVCVDEFFTSFEKQDFYLSKHKAISN